MYKSLLRIALFFSAIYLFSCDLNPFNEENVLNLLAENKINIMNEDSIAGNKIELNEIFGDKKIIALGEATHGTHEFFKI